MSWHVIISPMAERDLRAVSSWYESRKAGLGKELVSAVGKAINSLTHEPKRHPVYYRNLRRTMTGRFPNKISYAVEANKIIVFRILHAKRDHVRRP